MLVMPQKERGAEEMKTDQERREERRNYEADVFYEVWRSGGNPDNIDYDRLDDYRWDGVDPEKAASLELQRQRPKPEEPEGEES